MPARSSPAAAPAWAHPYTGTHALAVFYNDGGQGGGTPAPAPAAPSPADIAARAGQQQPPVTPPGQPASADPTPGDEPAGITQRRLNVIMKHEKEEGRRAALRQVAEAAGLDPETFDPAKFGDLFKQAEQARQAQLSEEQRRAEELANREKELADRLAAADQRVAEAAQRDRDSKVRAALVRLGATGDDLDDAARLITVPDDADDTAITQAADKLKERRGELFGATAPQQLPPAPSGAPAAGNAPRQPAPGKDAVKDAARARAVRMGLRTSDAA